MEYNPQAKRAGLLDTAYEQIKSVPYKVGLQWLFYRLLQLGLYTSKMDYHGSFKTLLSKARKEFYNEGSK